MNSLINKQCIPCSGGVPPLELDVKKKLLTELHSGWILSKDTKRLTRSLKLEDFSKALILANLIGEVADDQWHHPELVIGYGYLDIKIWTHKIDNLVESDYIFASKIDFIIEQEVG